MAHVPGSPPSPRRPASRRRRRGRRGLWWALGAGIAVVVAAAVAAVSLNAPASGPPHPAPGMALLVASHTQAAAEARAGAAEPTNTDTNTNTNTTPDAATRAAAYLATVPTSVWFTPEHVGVDEVFAATSTLLGQARDQEATPTIVIYGLPGRDCGQFSAGGLEPGEYVRWVEQIALALRENNDVPTIVILEPDSLALAPDCGNVDERAGQLRTAVEQLAADTTYIYLDAGHSNWRPVAEMAALINKVGLEGVRGFASNVSNYNTSSKEIAYAHSLSKALGGTHAVIDTSRSGNGATAEWCNPSGRLLGEQPGSFGDDVVDVNLFIKVPGESDGTCNGGPTAGKWWPKSAIELTRTSLD